MATATIIELDYYKVIDAAPDATTEELQRAYHAAAWIWHPDVSDADPTEVHRHMVRINRAWEVLGDEDRRCAYDQQRQRSTLPPLKPASCPPPSRFCWERARKSGNPWCRSHGHYAVVFQFKKGSKAGLWGFQIDGEFNDHAFDRMIYAKNAAESDLTILTNRC